MSGAGGSVDTVLVTGGAGFVGSHVCLALSQAGFRPVVYDDLSHGHAAFVQWGPLERGDIRDGGRLEAVVARYRPRAVVHLAGLIEVGDSCREPGPYFAINVGGALSVIEAARRGGVEAMVFSSTCAIYGDPVRSPIDETHPQAPLNPYGRSKLMVEQALADYARHVGFRSVCLRYFNAAGADFEGRIGERHHPETHVMPLAIQAALGQRQGFTLFGDDYDTRDGTAVRDYVHVLDLADAHVRALRYLLAGGQAAAVNLGSGTGTTVRELIAAIRDAVDAPFAVETAPRREGDAPSLVADIRRAREVLGWEPRRTLDDVVRSALSWHVAEGGRLALAAE
jgi:UDP-glucose 4-epimerase